MPAITVIGSLNMDLVVRCERLPQVGETLAGSEFHLIPGGKGANQAVSAARSGAVTRMVGCIGDDPFAALLLDSLVSSGVDTSGVATLKNTSTGTATIILENCGENRILIVAGANARVSPSFIEQQWPLIRQSDAILLQHEIPLETVSAILRRAHAEGILTVLNPAPVHSIQDELLALVDSLILNEIEAKALAGMDVTDDQSAIRAAVNLQRKGVSTVIVTLGSLGAILCNKKEILFQPAFKVETVDTTAAGDTFAGAYTASILTGKQPAQALSFAAAASALSVTRLGAQTSIPGKTEVESFCELHANDFVHSPVIRRNGGV